MGKKHKFDLGYLNEHYTIGGAFYWVEETYYAKLVPSAQRNSRPNLRNFGIGFLDTHNNAGKEVYLFLFFVEDLRMSYNFDMSSLLDHSSDMPGDFMGDTIDEVMQQVSAFIIVNGMCDLRHKELDKTLRLSL